MKALSIGIGLLASQAIAQTYTWKNVTVPAGGYVSGIDYSLVSQGLVYARTDMGGAYRWDNANSVWVPLTDMFSDWNLYGIESIAPDPKNANVVYAAIGQNYNGTNGFILSSTNQGNTWTQNNIGVVMGGNADGRNAGERLAVDPNLTSKLYFASRSGGLWVSTNSAATWAKVGAFPVNGDAGYGLSYVIFDQHGTTGTASVTIYVGVETMASGNSNLYRSTNSGASWALVPGGPTNMITPHASLGSDGNLWINYASGGYGPGGMTNGQVWKLKTSTLAWTNVTPAGGPPNGSGGYGGISVDAQNAQHVVVTTLDWYAANDKVLSTTNAGGAWTTIGNVSTGWNAGPFANYNNNGALWTRFCSAYDGGAGWAGDIKIDPFNSNNAIYTTGGGVWSSTSINAATQPAGVTWTFTDYGLEETAIQDFTSSVAGGVLFSAMGDINGMRHTNVTQSPTLGMYCNPSWNTTNGIDFAQLNTNFVVRDGDGLWVATQAGGYSTNNGQTWTAFPSNPAGIQQYSGNGQISVNTMGTIIVWALPGGVYYSTNNGTSWTASTGIPAGAQIGSDRASTNIFYGVSGTNLYVSTNGGASFTVAGTFAGGISWANRPRAVFGIAGEVWVPTSSGLYRYTNVGLGAVTTTKIANLSNAVAVGFGKAAPGYTHPAVYLVGTVNGTYGFFRCDDGVGTTWVRTNDANHQFGGPSFTAGDETIYGRMYLGTNGRGILYGDITLATTPTSTLTVTPTTTRTHTPTFTPTVTPTTTRTSTPTVTSTATLGNTSTFTLTSTPTRTSTQTMSPTTSATTSSTSTLTQTLTVTSTTTPTFSRTVTPTVTASASPTNTMTVTSTRTLTVTSTVTSPFTSTLTSTATTTHTSSVTSTVTPTQTPTTTRTATLTPSPTQTPTTTMTLTPTLTGTATATLQFSATNTLSPTVTSTPTSTGSSTSSMTPTASITASQTRTATPTNTLTYSPTVTSTFTSTRTPTLTPTSTPSVTSTATRTSTATVTGTSTPTSQFSPTNTLSPTVTMTFTASFTPTNSGTYTHTPTVTSTSTDTNTPTITSTWTITPTPTDTPTHTITSTFTPSYTPTNTSTFTATSSSTWTPTTTQTWTASPTPTTTFTRTWTWTFTPSWTGTPTSTFSPTTTPTITSTVSPTPTGTPAPTPLPGFVGIYPNPVSGPTVQILPPAYSGESSVRVELYTLAFRKVQDHTYPPMASGIAITLTLTGRSGNPLANGVYYVVVTVNGRHTIGKLLVIR